jgi:TusA-related sulfurtransferase
VRDKSSGEEEALFIYHCSGQETQLWYKSYPKATQYRIHTHTKEVETVAKNPAPLLDITSLVCPMTFVRTKLAVERLQPGQVLEVRMNFGEPTRNVPASLREHGYLVSEVQPENPEIPAGVHRLQVSKPMINSAR